MEPHSTSLVCVCVCVMCTLAALFSRLAPLSPRESVPVCPLVAHSARVIPSLARHVVNACGGSIIISSVYCRRGWEGSSDEKRRKRIQMCSEIIMLCSERKKYGPEPPARAMFNKGEILLNRCFPRGASYRKHGSRTTLADKYSSNSEVGNKTPRRVSRILRGPRPPLPLLSTYSAEQISLPEVV